jgi:hypothetical protein
LAARCVEPIVADVLHAERVEDAGSNISTAAAQAIVSGDLDAYDVEVERVYEQFLSNRAQAYSAEQRWPERPFWRDRHRVVRHPRQEVTARTTMKTLSLMLP